MATVGEVRNQPTLQNLDSSEVITLSSDEEEIEETTEDVNYLFDRFILACRPHLQNEALVNARNIFKEAPRDFVCSDEIASMLKRYTEQVNKDNAVVYMESFGATLADAKAEKQRCAPKHNNVEESRSTDGISDVGKARDFKEVESQDRGKNQTITNVVAGDSSKIEVSVADVSDDEVDFICEVKGKKSKEDDIPSTSTQCTQTRAEIKLPKSGKLAMKDMTVKQQKKLVARLKIRLKQISQEIKILNKSELTLDEMEMSDSNYIKENRLKQRFDKVWNKLCKILGRPPNTGRVVEKKVHASNTGYSIIDEAVEEFLDNKRGKFPDYFDIRDLVLEADKKHDLRMKPHVKVGLTQDIFTDIGNKMQRMREKDLIFNFGSHLLDDFKTEEDPALINEELSKQLEINRKISKKKLKHVYAKYTHLERRCKTGKKGEPSTSTDMENGNTYSEGTTTEEDDDEETNTSLNVGFSLSEESVDSSQPCSSRTIWGNGSRTNYERHCISDDESSENESTQSCKSRSLLSNHSPKTVKIDTKCPSECAASTTVNCVSFKLDKDLDVPLPCSSGALVNSTDQATNLKIENSVDNDTSIDNCQIVIDAQDEEAVSSIQASDAPVSLTCIAPIQTDEHKLPNIVNSTSVVNNDCENDDCQIIDSSDQKVGVSNTSQTCDCDTLSSSAFSVNTSSDKQKPNIDNPTIPPSDDCQIIIDSPDEEACSPTTSKVHSKPKLPSACSSPAITNEQKPNVATANTANRTNGKKRKASFALTSEDSNGSLIEKVALALKNKRLKTPLRNSTETTPRLSLSKFPGREPLKDKEIINGMNSPPSVNGKVPGQIPSIHLQVFREKTINALKSKLKNKQPDTTVVDYRGATSSISPTASESPRQETAKRTNSTNTITRNCEKQESEVIIIDD